MLSKDEILKADDLPYIDVKIEEWGGEVRVRTLTAGERDEYEASIYETDGTNVTVKREDFRAKMLALCIVDDKGNRMFGTKDISKLSGKSAKPIQQLFEVAQELNGLSADAQEEIEKN
jgi:hypothetical protein